MAPGRTREPEGHARETEGHKVQWANAGTEAGLEGSVRWGMETHRLVLTHLALTYGAPDGTIRNSNPFHLVYTNTEFTREIF